MAMTGDAERVPTQSLLQLSLLSGRSGGAIQGETPLAVHITLAVQIPDR